MPHRHHIRAAPRAQALMRRCDNNDQNATTPGHTERCRRWRSSDRLERYQPTPPCRYATLLKNT